MPRPRSVVIFCEVVDNFGDIGVCWRLARQMRCGQGLEVTLVVDDLTIFQRLCSEIEPLAGAQVVEGIHVLHWMRGAETLPPGVATADLIIEAFGCRIPETVLQHMAMRQPKPVWINLEYLSAESWVEGCHGLASPHPTLPLVKHFFFPGFTERTGGLLFEPERVRDENLDRTTEEGRQLVARLTGQATAPCESAACYVTLFCYPQAPVARLFETWRRKDRPVVCLVPEGVAPQQVESFLGQPARAGAWCLRDSLRLHVLPFLSQPDYDRLLRACHLNFVRGEDSFVRAQWAQRPFVWHIYAQEENAHLVKLNAFLERYTAGLPDDAALAVRQAWYAWNGANDGRDWWEAFQDAMPSLANHANRWARRLWRNGDLAGNLVEFASKFG